MLRRGRKQDGWCHTTSARRQSNRLTGPSCALTSDVLSSTFAFYPIPTSSLHYSHFTNPASKTSKNFPQSLKPFRTITAMPPQPGMFALPYSSTHKARPNAHPISDLPNGPQDMMLPYREPPHPSAHHMSHGPGSSSMGAGPSRVHEEPKREKRKREPQGMGRVKDVVDIRREEYVCFLIFTLAFVGVKWRSYHVLQSSYV